MSQTQILLDVGTNELELVEFYLDEPDGYRGYYGINVSKVIEISRMQTITAMPETPHPSVIGAFPFRDGRIVPVIDIGRFLNKTLENHKDPRIIITEFNTAHTAFLVSGVTRIHRISWKQVEPPGQVLTAASKGSITAVVKLEGRIIFVLDAEAIVGAMNPSLSIHMDIDEDAPKPEQHYTILHADDSMSIRNLVKNLLEKEGYFNIIQVEDGEMAWQKLLEFKAQSEAEGVPLTNFVQGIISDIEMPNLDGLTLCKQIKEDAVLKQLPVAMFSSMISDSLSKKCATVGADAQYAKPDLGGISIKMRELIEATA